MKVEINGNLTPWQLKIASALRRFNIIRAGRRTGKTYLASYLMLKHAIQHPNSLCWYVSLDIATSTELAIPQFEALCPPELIVSKNKQTRTYKLYNGSVIVWKTMDNMDSLRGRGLDLVILEEAAFSKQLKVLWEDIISAQLMGRGGRAIFISSPNGSNYFRRLEASALEDINKDINRSEWSVQTGTIYDNPNISVEEIERKRSITPELTWQQEFLGQYCDQVGLVYWEYKPLVNIVDIPPPNAVVTRIRGLDWGLDDNTACAYIALLDNKKAYVYDEYVANNLDATEQAKRIVEHGHGERFQRSIMDKSCWNRDADLDSVAKRFNRGGINDLFPGTGDFDGSVSDMKALIANGDVLIHSKCVNLHRAIESWQHGSHEPDILAATRYGIDGLVRSGKMLAPIRTHKPRTFQDLLREEAEMQRRLERINRAKHGGPSVVFKVYNNLS